jgi:hypothetical protein
MIKKHLTSYSYMNFSNKFKIVWWSLLLIVLTFVGIYRFSIGDFTGFDSYLLIFWFILVLFPIISEISMFGINIKKDLETAKNEIKSQINEIKNQINYSPTINVNTEPADKVEYENKVKEDIKEDVHPKPDKKLFALSPNDEEIKRVNTGKSQERFNKVISIEKLVSDYLRETYGNNYKPQMKIQDEFSRDKIIVDGLIFKGGRMEKIIEIKYIGAKTFEHIPYVINRHIRKIFKFGLRVPIKFIIVSENLNGENLELVKKQVNMLNFTRRSSGLSKIEADLFAYSDDKISKVG